MWHIYFGINLREWDSHQIDINNLVDGKPVYYWKNQTGGTIPSGAGQVILANCEEVLIQNQKIANIPSGILLGFSSKNNITGNNLSFNDYGIRILGGSKNKIINNFLSNNEYGIDFYYSNENDIINNDITKCEYGIHLYNSSGNKISQNNASDNVDAFFSEFSKFNNITYNIFCINRDNDFHIGFNNGIYIYNSDNNYISNNYVQQNDIDIYVWGSKGNDIINNNLSSSEFLGGLSLGHSNETNISGNTGNIGLFNSDWNNISTNYALNYGKISLTNSYYNNISYNLVKGGKGINIISSERNTIFKNDISENKYGIKLESSYENNFTFNTVSDNNLGIHTTSSKDNVFHHNNIINNEIQFYQYNGMNIWDDNDGEGNYWDDYTGTDTDSDGVGDTDLPHHDVDYYPLIDPVDIANYTESSSDNEGSVFSELWFIGSITLLIICILLLLILMSHKKKRNKSLSDIDNQESFKEQK
jgi:parallel beta-helix repeat protein